jgi:hypothetical protein
LVFPRKELLMSGKRKAVRALQVVCLALSLTVAWQLKRSFVDEDPLDTSGLVDAGVSSSRAAIESVAESPAAVASGSPAEANGKSPPPLSPTLAGIVTSAVFGAAPAAGPPPPPVLVAVLVDRAILRWPDNNERTLVLEGDAVEGAKLLALDTNRALIHFHGQDLELTLFGGLGSETLLKPEEPTP